MKMINAFKTRNPKLLAFLTLAPFIVVFPLLNNKKNIAKYIVACISGVAFALMIDMFFNKTSALIFASLWFVGLSFYFYRLMKANPPEPPIAWYATWKLVAVLSVIYAIVGQYIIQANENRTLFFKLNNIVSQSMAPTLKHGDYVYSSMNVYKNSPPQRGDVVIFIPTHEKDNLYIKRIVGLPNDKIQIKAGVPYINGIAVKQERVDNSLPDEGGRTYTQFKETYSNGKEAIVIDSYYRKGIKGSDETDVITVPENHYFLMGDNRGNSLDSRSFGTVSGDKILGRVKYIYFNKEEKRFKFEAVR